MRLVRPLLISLALLLPAAMQATPITFALDHGGVTARVELNGTLIGTGAGFLDAGFVVFDPSTGLIPNFSLHSSNANAFAPGLPGAYDALALSILIAPASGYSVSATGTGPWSITLGPIDVAYSGTAFDSTLPVTVPPVPVSGIVPINSFGVTAYYNAGQMRLGLLGLKIGEVRIGATVYDVRADIEFVGFAAPEPASGALTALALVGLAWTARRR